MPSILVFVLFFAGVYFLLLRPQQQRVRRQRELITAIDVGDRVVTAGGLIGRVVEIDDDRLLLEVADGVVVELLRLAISRRLDDSEAISDSVFGSTSTSDELEEAYAADDYDPDSEAVPADHGADGDADGESGVRGESGELSGESGESGELSGTGVPGDGGEVREVGEATEAGGDAIGGGAVVPGISESPSPGSPGSAGSAGSPGSPGSPGSAGSPGSPGGAATDGTIQEAAAPAPRQDPH